MTLKIKRFAISVPYVISALMMIACSNGSGGAGSGLASSAAFKADLATIAARQGNHSYPRLAADTQVSWGGNAGNGFLGRNLYSRLHWFDYLIIDGNVSPTTSYSTLPNFTGYRGSIRRLNPNSVQTAYFSIGDFINYAPGICYQPLLTFYAFGSGFSPTACVDPGTDDMNTSGFLHDVGGNLLNLYPFTVNGTTYYSHIPNPSNLYWQQRYMNTVQTLIIANQNVDGIYHDWGAFPTIPYQSGAWAYTTVSLNNNGIADMNAPAQIGSAANPVNQAWLNGLLSTYAQERSAYPTNFIITANSGWGGATLPASMTNALQGSQSEDFLTAVNAFNGAANSGGIGWSAAMYTYGTMTTNGQSPNFSFILADLVFGGSSFNANNLLYDLMQSSANNWITTVQMASLRFALASTLMFNGYFASTNTNASGGYSAAFWMDEFAVNSANQAVVPTDATASAARVAKGWLGQPLGAAFNVSSPTQTLLSVLATGPGNSASSSVWRRNFMNGIVLVNPTGAAVNGIALNGTFKKIIGIIDPSINDGSTGLTTISLPAQAGIVLHN